MIRFSSDMAVIATISDRGELILLKLLEDTTEDDLQAALRGRVPINVNGTSYRLRGLERYATNPPKPPLKAGNEFPGIVKAWVTA